MGCGAHKKYKNIFCHFAEPGTRTYEISLSCLKLKERCPKYISFKLFFLARLDSIRLKSFLT